MTKHRLMAAALACVALLTLGLYLGAGRWRSAADAQRTPGVPAVLRVGYAVEAPYALIDARGEVDGESPGLARLVVQRWPGVRIEWVQTNFDRLIPELLARRFDVIAAGLFITPERALRVRFSEPSVVVHPGLLMRADEPLATPTWAGLAGQDSLRVAVIDQAVEQAELRRLGVVDQRLLVVPDAATGRAAVEARLADALALSLPAVRALAADRPGLLTVRLQPEPGQPRVAGIGHVGFAFRPQDVALRQAWLQAQAQVQGQAQHMSLLQRLGFSAADLPQGLRLADLLPS